MDSGLLVQACEFTTEGSFSAQEYLFKRTIRSHDGEPLWGAWRVKQRGTPEEEEVFPPSAGYTPLRVRLCGLCGTDVARAALPFPLPQVRVLDF
jgi:hypothetical protein